MTARGYTLTELARRTSRSKGTLLEMLEDGRLTGTRADVGRREWRITDEAARAAGLDPQCDGTIDTAVRSFVADEFGQVGDALAQQLADIDNRLGSVEDLLRKLASEPRPSIWQRLWTLIVSRRPNSEIDSFRSANR